MPMSGSKRLADTRPPRFLLRLPLWLYRARLGWLLGHRVLMLTHTGRKSGRPRYTVLEVVRHDRATGAYVVASGWGEQADWLRNVAKTPDVFVTSGGRTFAATALRLDPDEAEREARAYARRHPFGFRHVVGLFVGQPFTRTEEDCRAMARAIPFVALRPKTPPA